MKWESKYAGNKKWIDILLKVREASPPPVDDASFHYPSATYCTSGDNPTPIITGTSGGVFTSSPGGLSLNSSTGEIDLDTSALGTYYLTYTVGIDNSSITMDIVNTSPNTVFTYPDNPFCQGGANSLPSFSPGSYAGIFTASPGFVYSDALVFKNVNTGEIDLDLTMPDQYNITNTIPASGGCSGSSDFTTIFIAIC